MKPVTSLPFFFGDWAVWVFLVPLVLYGFRYHVSFLVSLLERVDPGIPGVLRKRFCLQNDSSRWSSASFREVGVCLDMSMGWFWAGTKKRLVSFGLKSPNQAWAAAGTV